MTTSHAVPDGRRRQRILTALLAMPAVVAALGLCGIEAWRVVNPDSRLFALPFAYSLADAIAAGDVEQAHGYLRAGHDPNQSMAVRDLTLTGGRWILVPPLLWAVATGHVPVVKMLLGHGARTHGPPVQQAVCLADALGRQDIVGVLRMLADEGPREACTVPAGGGTPLLYVADEG
jgi:hypothetical protein